MRCQTVGCGGEMTPVGDGKYSCGWCGAQAFIMFLSWVF